MFDTPAGKPSIALSPREDVANISSVILYPSRALSADSEPRVASRGSLFLRVLMATLDSRYRRPKHLAGVSQGGHMPVNHLGLLFTRGTICPEEVSHSETRRPTRWGQVCWAAEHTAWSTRASRGARGSAGKRVIALVWRGVFRISRVLRREVRSCFW